MLDELQSLFKKEFQLTHFAALINNVSNLSNICSEQFVNDKDSKNSAIDTVCQMLQQYKNPPQNN